jgi:phosphoribosylformylglycinamidine synthase
VQVQVTVTLKTGVLDPQGKAVHHALENLGFGGINDVRIGKIIMLDVAPETSRESIAMMCEQMLANGVIENYAIAMPTGALAE